MKVVSIALLTISMSVAAAVTVGCGATALPVVVQEREDSLRLDGEFARLALDYLDTDDEVLLDELAQTGGAAHIAAHAAMVSMTEGSIGTRELVRKTLSDESLNGLDISATREKLARVLDNRESQARCWKDAVALLPEGALSESTLFLTVGYDIGVAVDGSASINIAHPQFSSGDSELWYYCVHEMHHVGFMRHNPMPKLRSLGTTGDLADLIRYLTAMEGMAVHAARAWREENGDMEADGDYVALVDRDRMERYEDLYFTTLRGLESENRPLREEDWNVLQSMSTGDRLWYRVGAQMAFQIEQSLGREKLIEAIMEGPDKFFEIYEGL